MSKMKIKKKIKKLNLKLKVYLIGVCGVQRLSNLDCPVPNLKRSIWVGSEQIY